MKPSGLYVHISHWNGKFALSPCPEDWALFNGMRLLFTTSGRTIVLSRDPDIGGAENHELDPGRNAGLDLGYQWPMNRKPWARFRRHVVELAESSDTQWAIELPADHQLPWPVPRNYGKVDNAAMAYEELGLRFWSAYRAGGLRTLRETMDGVPNVFRTLAGNEGWKSVVDDIAKNGETP